MTSSTFRLKGSGVRRLLVGLRGGGAGGGIKGLGPFDKMVKTLLVRHYPPHSYKLCFWPRGGWARVSLLAGCLVSLLSCMGLGYI